MGAPLSALGPHGVLDAVDLLLVAAAVHHGALLGVPQCSLQGLNSLSSRPKPFLQLWKLTAQICIVTYQLEEERDVTQGVILDRNHKLSNEKPEEESARSERV